MSQYADYLRERTTDHIIERDDGFITYRYLNEGRAVYVVDVYVVPGKRHKGVATELAGSVLREAKSKGAVEMIGSVVPSAKGSTDSLKVLLAYGMDVHSAGQDYIFFKKAI